MEQKLNEGILSLYPKGRIDSANAEAVEREINDALNTCPCKAVVLDLSEITYLSSAGLRVLLRLKKRVDDLEITEVAPAVYDILEMTGFTEIMNVHRAFETLSVDGLPVIGQGAKSVVYRIRPDTIVKVYRDAKYLPRIRRERRLARTAFVLGIPTAISYEVVRVGESYGSVFELLDARSLSLCIREEPEKQTEYVSMLVRLLRQIHTTEVDPQDMPPALGRLREWIRNAESAFTPEQTARLRALIEAIPEAHTMIHGDFHTNNVMLQDGEAVLIDMDTLAYGHPINELCNIHATFVGLGLAEPKIVEDFIGLPYDTCRAIWAQLLREYLGTDDPARLEAVQDRISLLSCLRCVSHELRRGRAGSPLAVLAHDEVVCLLDRVDRLDF